MEEPHINYLDKLVPETFNTTVTKLSKLIKRHYPAVNVIAGRGLSGSMIIPALAAKMKLQWAIVRKESSHSDYKVEVSNIKVGKRNKKVYIVVVDDLIESGKTYKTVKKQVTSKYAMVGIGTVFLGAALYNCCVRIERDSKL